MWVIITPHALTQQMLRLQLIWLPRPLFEWELTSVLFVKLRGLISVNPRTAVRLSNLNNLNMNNELVLTFMYVSFTLSCVIYNAIFHTGLNIWQHILTFWWHKKLGAGRINIRSINHQNSTPSLGSYGSFCFLSTATEALMDLRQGLDPAFEYYMIIFVVKSLFTHCLLGQWKLQCEPKHKH